MPEGTDKTRLRALADRLIVPLRALGAPAVEVASNGVHAARRFLLPRAGLFLSEARLDQLSAELEEQKRSAFRRQIGADLDDAEETPAPWDEAKLHEQLLAQLGPLGRYSSGYFEGPTPTGTALVVVVKSAVLAGELARLQTSRSNVASFA